MTIKLSSNKIMLDNHKIILLLFLIGLILTINAYWGFVLIIVILFAIGITTRINKLPQTFLGFMGVVLLGYMIGGRGFAYLGIYPIFIGEITLLFGLLVLPSLTKNLFSRMPIKIPLIALVFLGFIHLNTDIPKYGFIAIRDSVIWVYALFAIVFFLVMSSKDEYTTNIVRNYNKILPFVVIIIPILFLIFRFNSGLIPTWPIGSGINIPIIYPKAGDIAVHLSGIIAFLLLGLYNKKDINKYVPLFIIWFFWLLGFFLVSTTSRSAFLTITFSTLLIGLFRSLSQSLKVLFFVGIVLLMFEITDVSIDVGTTRNISTQQIFTNIQSIMSNTDHANLEGSKKWRLLWWKKIFEYTFYGEYFWDGKGFGLNLASDDGFQVLKDNSLRSPHNSHLTFLARMGVPGFLVWIILQTSFATILLVYYRKLNKYRLKNLANLNIWVFVYWTAFLVNGAFDVFLEGPQGGIWFWCLIGFGLGLISYEKKILSNKTIVNEV